MRYYRSLLHLQLVFGDEHFRCARHVTGGVGGDAAVLAGVRQQHVTDDETTCRCVVTVQTQALRLLSINGAHASEYNVN